MKLSARNQLPGTVVAIEKGAVNGIVTIEVAPGLVITSSITNAAIDELGLAPVWVGYRDDRRWGRAREALAAHGVRPTVVRPISEVVK